MLFSRPLYTVVFYIALPFVLLRLAWRGFKAPAYWLRWGERFGFFSVASLPDKPSLWVHAVSVGETIAAAPMIRLLQQEYADYHIVVTTTTPTGSECVTKLFQRKVFHVYAPYDIPFSVNRFIGKVKPKKAIIMETELWPNMLHCCHRHGIPVIIANARLSEKSAGGYRRFGRLTKQLMSTISAIAAQNTADAQRFIDLGIEPNKVSVTGSIKFDVTLADELVEQAHQLKQQWSDGGKRAILIAASTHVGEEEIILDAFGDTLSQHERTLLILVPRHPERFELVRRLCESRGFNIQQRSQKEPISASTQVLLGDTMGELTLLFGTADIAFVGGSFIPNGGHNLLEPAVWCLPVLAGPSDFNFAEISQLLQSANALSIVGDQRELAKEYHNLLTQPALRQAMGEAAGRVVEENRGALARLMEVIRKQE